MTLNIGDWVQRERRGVPHLVESIVSGDVVTRCGRRLTDEPTKTGGRLARLGFISTDPYCEVCSRGHTWTFAATNTESTTVSYP